MFRAPSPIRSPRRWQAVAGLAAVPLAVAIVTLTACLPVPVGDPSKSEVKPKLNGAWLREQEDKSSLYVVRPYDERTHLVQWFDYKAEYGSIQPKQAGVAKLWFTTIKGKTFAVMKPLNTHRFLGMKQKGKRFYIVGRLSVSGDEATLRPTDPNASFLKGVDTREDAEAAIRKHVDDDALYQEAVTLSRAGDDDKERVRSVLEAFHVK